MIAKSTTSLNWKRNEKTPMKVVDFNLCKKTKFDILIYFAIYRRFQPYVKGIKMIFFT